MSQSQQFQVLSLLKVMYIYKNLYSHHFTNASETEKGKIFLLLKESYEGTKADPNVR